MYKILKLNYEKEFEEIILPTNYVSYDDIRNAVGGFIERVTFNIRLDKLNINVYVDEDGKCKNLEPTTAVADVKTKEIIDVLAGPLVFTNRVGEHDLPLTEIQQMAVKEILRGGAEGIDLTTGERINLRLLPYERM